MSRSIGSFGTTLALAARLELQATLPMTRGVFVIPLAGFVLGLETGMRLA
jgi:hypothetical protein